MSFIHENFMLQNETAKHLYHDYAKDLPIIDYHCHLPPKEIAEDHVFEDITELWLAGDHYKWRAMRANGVPEDKVTGNASSKEKFQAWAETAEVSLGNPLFHWTQLELKRYFDIDDLLTSENWEAIYDETNKQLKEREITAQALIRQSNVEFIGTTDTPFDSLEYHEEVAKDSRFSTRVAPSFRPDELFEPTKEEIKKLEDLTQQRADSYEAFRQIVEERVNYFDARGALISDHGMTNIYYKEANEAELDAILSKWKQGLTVTDEEKAKWMTRLLVDLGKMYYQRGWVMQIHFGAIRSANTRLFKQLGANIGADSINDQPHVAKNLNQLLDAMDKNGQLPKMILYNLNPEYNHVIASTVANFQSNQEGIKGKVQFGAGWWFNDTEQGMLRQMETLADHGLLMHFVGMLTDSRSFVSYPRHEYFRRILCNFIGEQVENGKFPKEESLLKKLVENICYYNAKNYFQK
jgi:glucuronate isomerase